jgi:hypothetical protein
MAVAHVPLEKDKPNLKPKTCSGSETGDVIGSLTAQLGLAAAGTISPPGVMCGTGAAHLAFIVGEESGIVCGGSLKTESSVWRGVNIGRASATAISCVPIVGNIFSASKTVYTAGELTVPGVGEGVSKQGGRVVQGPLPAACHSQGGVDRHQAGEAHGRQGKLRRSRRETREVRAPWRTASRRRPSAIRRPDRPVHPRGCR